MHPPKKKVLGDKEFISQNGKKLVVIYSFLVRNVHTFCAIIFIRLLFDRTVPKGEVHNLPVPEGV